ncbi:uncharacterized protein LOC143470867 [Clavelina lepadiformis]|uniref:uncharacterized protein LOC143470867 n=1 Tax=Clavelina lepadiformis TaxID=159417 RepID=UPI004042A570
MPSLSPLQIRFTQDSIGMYFQDGDEVNDACEKIALEKLSANQFPTIKTFKRDNQLYSLDNRRLYVFRVSEKLGLLEKVEVIFTNRTDHRDVTTENNGCHVTVRNNKKNGRWVSADTYWHCSCSQFASKSTYPDWWDKSLGCHKKRRNIYRSTPSNLHIPNSQARQKPETVISASRTPTSVIPASTTQHSSQTSDQLFNFSACRQNQVEIEMPESDEKPEERSFLSRVFRGIFSWIGSFFNSS